MWDAQVAELSHAYRLIRYDYRGHGRSPVSGDSCTLETLGRDALAVLDAFEISQTNFVGLSLGGLIGMYLGAHHRERFQRLVLCNTSPFSPAPEKWNERIRQAMEEGMDRIALNTFQRWLRPDFEHKQPHAYQALVRRAREIPPEGYAGLCTALRDADMRSRISEIELPTLVIGSSADVTSVEQTRQWASALPDARVCIIEDAGHLSNIDRPQEFTGHLQSFLA